MLQQATPWRLQARRSAGGTVAALVRLGAYHVENDGVIRRIAVMAVGAPVLLPLVQLHVTPHRDAVYLKDSILKVGAVAWRRPPRVEYPHPPLVHRA